MARNKIGDLLSPTARRIAARLLYSTEVRMPPKMTMI